MPSNLYKVLGIGKGATPSQVKKAFVALAKQYHPDSKNGHPEMFQQVSEAYKVLSDPLKRAEYDLELNRQNMSESLHKFQQDDTGLDMYADEQKIRTINMTEEEKEKLIQEMARRKKEFRKTHENMFREMRKQKRSPFKLILFILGGVLFLWSVKLTMWYNSVYKNWKGTDEILDAVHPFASETESTGQKSMSAPENLTQRMLIQKQDKAYVDATYYKQNPTQSNK